MKNALLLIVSLFCVQLMAQPKDKLTPELLFKLGRVNNPQLSADGKTVLYEVKNYDVASNKGTNIIYTLSLPSGKPVAVSEAAQNAFDVQWRPDGKKITFLSASSGSVQLW